MHKHVQCICDIFYSQYNFMGSENHKTVARRSMLALITLCYLLPNEFADGRKIFAARRHSLELAKNKGALKSIKGENGEVIDCVDIYKQPAFDHPLLKNHIIEMHPNLVQKGVEGQENQASMLSQGWHKSGECPKGTIPILRTPKSFYPRKVPPILVSTLYNHSFDDTIPPPGHEYAQVTLEGGKYEGVKAKINVWNPATYYTEFSIAQIWLVSGQNENVNTMEAGWMVISGENQTRLFIYWTSDGYTNKGCYNLECPGFIQINNNITLGSTIQPVSSYNGDQYEISVSISKNEIGQWWLEIQNQFIGYWPSSIFTTIADSAERINWGGEIINTAHEGHHTSTQMGSGHFPSEGFRKASYFGDLKYMDDSGVFRVPETLFPYVTKPSCYDLQVVEDRESFFYGGPGYSETCQT